MNGCECVFRPEMIAGSLTYLILIENVNVIPSYILFEGTFFKKYPGWKHRLTTSYFRISRNISTQKYIFLGVAESIFLTNVIWIKLHIKKRKQVHTCPLLWMRDSMITIIMSDSSVQSPSCHFLLVESCRSFLWANSRFLHTLPYVWNVNIDEIGWERGIERVMRK